MRYLSVCSGIEAASVAWHPLGWKPLAFSEIEAFPRAVLQHHCPDTPLHGDFTVLRDQSWIVDADVLVGGTPCQAFSVAGLRNSLADERGNLSLEFVRLADAIDAARLAAARSPGIVVWENVPGVLSVKDNAFGCFLAALAGEDTPLIPTGGKWTNAGVVIGPARSIAWRILDAQYFGLAQRRRRVFVVASARKGFDPAAVLLEFEGLRRDSPPRREAGKIAPTIPSRSTAGGGLGTDFDCDGGVIQHWPADIASTLNAAFGDKQGLEDQRALAGASLFVPHAVTHALRGEGFDASEDGTGRGTPLVPVHSVGFNWQNGGGYGNANDGLGITEEGTGPLQRCNTPAVAIVFSAKDHGADASEDLSPTLRAMPHHESHANGGGQMAVAIPFDTTQITSPANYSKPKEGDPCHPLAAGAHPPAVAFSIMPQNSGRDYKAREVEVAQPIMAVRDVASTIGQRMRGQDDSCADNLQLTPTMAVRRLTPVECERLQGFPDGYTNIPWRGKPEAPDGPRYKALGNSMAVPVMRWIGQRITEALR